EPPSPALVRRLAERATRMVDDLGEGAGVEQPFIRRALLQLAATAALVTAALLFGPESWRDLARGFLVPWTPAEAVVPARVIAVEPGDRTVPRGSSLDIQANARGFVPGDAMLHFLRDGETEWQAMP